VVGTPVSDDTPHLAKISVALESSPSLIALAARENRPVHAFDLADASGGAGIDRVLARILGSTGLLCVPMSGARGVYGVTVAGLSLPQAPGWEDEVALLLSLNSAATSTVESVVGNRELLERARNELIGEFQAAGRRFVHEAGNPLGIVKNYLRLLGNRLGPSGEFAEELTVLNEELDRVGRIVQRMRDPLAAESEESGPLDLNALVREALRLYGEALFASRRIEVHHQLDPGIPVLSADARSFKQVLLNLLTNAAEAMPNSGRLSLATADNVNLEGEIYVSLQVSDTGAGIPPEVMQRLFQPGTSTKGEGHEGIGLAVSAAIVKRHGGRILCRSTLGRGTIFLLLLPRRPVEPRTSVRGQ
jgi:signal transduction histidine kinase